MGYVLVKSPRPGAPDRPLVYSGSESGDHLFYPTDEPQYSWYPGFGSGQVRKQGGQFRDVSLWAPHTSEPRSNDAAVAVGSPPGSRAI